MARQKRATEQDANGSHRVPRKRKAKPAAESTTPSTVARAERIEWADAIEIPAECPRCGSDKLRSTGGVVREQRSSGQVLGCRFDRVRWKRRRCGGCGQRVMVRSYSQKVESDPNRD